jgi:hypothetical protein
VAIHTDNNWLLHAGDAFYFQEDLNFEVNKKNIASELLQYSLAMNNPLRLKNLERLSELKKTGRCKITNSHDPRL